MSSPALLEEKKGGGGNFTITDAEQFQGNFSRRKAKNSTKLQGKTEAAEDRQNHSFDRPVAGRIQGEARRVSTH